MLWYAAIIISNKKNHNMKKFLYSFLGTMAGIWLSVLLGGVLLVFTIIALAGSSDTKSTVESGSVLRINLSGIVVDQATAPSIMDVVQDNVDTQLSLSEIVQAIKYAKDDSRIEGILLDCKGAYIGVSQCEDIINALKEFKTSNKWIWAYADTYTQTDYFVASAADSVFLNPIGMVNIHGLSGQVIFFKGLMDKIGVEAQIVKVGTYKSAVEPFMLTEMSDANRQQMTHYIGRIWDNMKQDIAKNRNTHADSVNSWADSYTFSLSAEDYLNLNIVDALKYTHELEELVAEKTQTTDPKFIELEDYYTSISSSLKNTSASKRIAVLYAVGDITEDGDDGIASDRLVPQIADLTEDESIDGLILRVNSGGGSAFASEQIWEALEQFKAKTGKPFYVSMGDMAASGGYYISCGADSIYASPYTLTGSIGIFGIIPNVEPLIKGKLGVNVETVETNTGNMPTLLQAMTGDQREAMQSYVDRGYELFVKRCADGRGMTIDQIKAIAEGRVWDGTSALENGLVDKLGGLQTAINDMAMTLGTDVENIDVVEYPEVEDQWWKVLAELEKSAVMASTLTGEGDLPQKLYQKLEQRIRNIDPLQCRTNYVYLK